MNNNETIKNIGLKFIKSNGGYIRKRCLHLPDKIGLDGLTKIIHKDIFKILNLKKIKTYCFHTGENKCNYFFNKNGLLEKELTSFGAIFLKYNDEDLVIEKTVKLHHRSYSHHFYLNDNDELFSSDSKRIIYKYDRKNRLIRKLALPLDSDRFYGEVWYDSKGIIRKNKIYSNNNILFRSWRNINFKLFHKLHDYKFWNYRTFIKEERTVKDNSYIYYI